MKYPPLKTKKIIVFSEENKKILNERWSFNENDIIVKNSRFCFDTKKLCSYNINEKFNIGYITSLRKGKFKAFIFFIDELVKSKRDNNLNVDIIGNGSDIDIFVNYVKQKNLDFINFIGYKNIDLNSLEKYNLIVTQGRGIIESGSICIPCSICGENGYKGIVTEDNINKFMKTNFTGRSFECSSNLSEDIEYLRKNGNDFTKTLSDNIRKEFDISYLREEIINLDHRTNMIPSNGSIVRTIIDNLSVFTKKAN